MDDKDEIISRQANTILFQQKLINELREENKALRKKIARFSTLLHEIISEMDKLIKIEDYERYIIETTYEEYKAYLESKRLIKPEDLERLSVVVFLPICYRYVVENRDFITYDELIEWMREHKLSVIRIVYSKYSKQTIFRCLRKLRELGYLKTPEKLQGEFMITEKGVQALMHLKHKKLVKSILDF